MSAKLINPLMDENPDLHKQIGCMNGIFQLFNRQHFLGSRVSSHSHKRLAPGQSGNHVFKPNSIMQKNTETNPEEVVREKQRASVESSRTSFSSTCSSTFSSVDCNKTAKPETSYLSNSIFPESPSHTLPTKQPNSSSLDLRDVVKDSINRETRGLAVKTRATAEKTSRIVKHIDSPRPHQLSISTKPNISGLDRTFQVLAKLREEPRRSKEEKPRVLLPKDAPRFSYDERESRDKGKSTIKLKELPRLSLDSKASSIRAASESRSNYLLDDLQQRSVKSSQTLNPHQEPGSNKRPSSVVAKLMGIEAFPDSMSANNDLMRKIKCCPDEDLDAMSTTSRKADESKYSQVSRSPRTPQSKPPSPKSRNINPVMKPNSVFLQEPAPWRQPDGVQGRQKPASFYQEAQHSHRSVYGEIDKKLPELDFKRSDRDLRALKQILDAMRKTQNSSGNKKEEQASDMEPQASNNSPSALKCNQQIIHTFKGTGPLKNFESSMFGIKPAKVVQKPGNLCSSIIPIEGMTGLRKLRTSANVETYTSKQTPKASQNMSGGSPTSSGRSSTLSPRLQQQKHEMEKQSRHNAQTSDTSRARRHLSKQQMESGSPRRKIKPKSPYLQQGYDQLSEFRSETRQPSHQGDAISVKSESNASSASQTDIEVTSIDRSRETYDAYQHKDQKNKMEARLSEDRSKAETTTGTLEQPSPVSVLDASFYREGSPSPVKKISNAFKDEESQNFDDAEWKSVDLEDLLSSTGPKLGTEFAQEKLESINHMVHELRQVKSTHDELAKDYIRSLCENTNPDNRYITEILLASGLLKDLGSSSTIIQLHPSGHLINPNMFHVLEQSKTRIEITSDERSNDKIGHSKLYEKIHRQLIFDTVNEILVRKLTSAGFSEPWISPNKLRVRSLTGQKLLKELCSEMDHLQANSDSSLHDEDNCLINNHSEISEVVLHIERLIFKDLISEVVSGDAAGLPAKHYRRLFPE